MCSDVWCDGRGRSGPQSTQQAAGGVFCWTGASHAAVCLAAGLWQLQWESWNHRFLHHSRKVYSQYVLVCRGVALPFKAKVRKSLYTMYVLVLCNLVAECDEILSSLLKIKILKCFFFFVQQCHIWTIFDSPKNLKKKSKEPFALFCGMESFHGC